MLLSRNCLPILRDKKLPYFLALFGLAAYLWPLFSFSPLYVETFDNMDSTIVWMKILANSGKIFAEANATVPQMMNGLPRISYGSEYNVLFWLYYFFSAETAYRINALLMHIVAFVSMALFLQRYILVRLSLYRHWIVAMSALLYALLPLWPGAGLSTSLLPLYTLILLDIHFRRDHWLEWAGLLLLPLYSNFIFLYMFYIVFAFAGWAGLVLWERRVDWRMLGGIVLMTVAFLAPEYRLLLAQVTGTGFVSHREEFDIYFNHDFMQAYAMAVKFFLDGWMEHQRSLMMPLMLPLVVTSLLLSLVKKQLSVFDSVVVLILFGASMYFEVWKVLLIHRYTFPLLLIFSLGVAWRTKTGRLLGFLLALQIVLAFYNGMCFYDGLASLKEYFDILNTLNISRAAFVQPFIWYTAVAVSFLILAKKIHFFPFVLAGAVVFQFYYSTVVRRFQGHEAYKLMTFESYYAPDLFSEVNRTIGRNQSSYRVVSYGIEPAVTLYNGFYTVDGYSTNYPLQYKHAFRKVQENVLNGCREMRSFTTSGGARTIFCVLRHVLKTIIITKRGILHP